MGETEAEGESEELGLSMEGLTGGLTLKEMVDRGETVTPHAWKFALVQVSVCAGSAVAVGSMTSVCKRRLNGVAIREVHISMEAVCTYTNALELLVYI